MVFVVGVIKNYYNRCKKSRKGTKKIPHSRHIFKELTTIHTLIKREQDMQRVQNTHLQRIKKPAKPRAGADETGNGRSRG
jgi:hypothetical protein